MRNISLRTKFLGITVGVIVALGLVVIIFIQTTLTQKLTSELQKRESGLLRESIKRKVSIDRELKMVELKKKIKELEEARGEK